jgi:restriction system protein
MTDIRVWVVRGGDYNELASQVPQKLAIAIGWSPSLDVARITSRDELRDRMEELAPGSGTPNAVGQLYRFAREIEESDYVLTPEKATKKIHISHCAGDYRFDPTMFGEAYPHVRPLRYLRAIDRLSLPVTIRNTLGSTLTVFRADAALPFIQEPIGELTQPLATLSAEERRTEAALWADEIEGQARGQILESLDEIEHHDFQLFVAGLLEALGYKARVGQKGKDGGVDVLAFPDVFGLTSPRIKVQVKNQKATAGHQDVGYLNGILGTGERGLFICTGGFSNDAKNAAFVRDGRVALVDGYQLLDLLLEHYEAMPTKAKSLLPLRRVYVPEQSARE